MSSLDELKAKYKLSQEKIDEIAEILIENYTLGARPAKEPIAVILGGQPGSGKSELTTAARTLIGEQAVICNADDYRDLHPKAGEIKRLHEKLYPDITADYSKPWNDRLKSYCEEHRLHFILETTFSSGEQMNNTIAAIKEKGYKVYVMVLSVNKQLSFLGTRIRYESMKFQDGYGRLVDKAVHDQKYEAVLNTLEVVEQSHLYDRLLIYGRAGRQKVKGMRNGLVMISDTDHNAFAGYKSEREKEWSDNDQRFFNQDILYLIRMMIGRKATHKELLDVLDIFEAGKESPGGN